MLRIRSIFSDLILKMIKKGFKVSHYCLSDPDRSTHPAKVPTVLGKGLLLFVVQSMCLAVQSQHSLDLIQQWVEETFALVSNNRLER